MAIYSIADLHLSTFTDKPMDIFEGWVDYINKIKINWDKTISEEDTVVIPGDLSWAINLEEALSDFQFIHRLKGKKILLKGNHDYWYSTVSKVNSWLKENSLESISILNNNSFMVNDIAIAGTRGWILDRESNENMKIYSREQQRLERSLEDALSNNPRETIVFMHFPPIYANYIQEEFIQLLNKYSIKRCYYGHVHGNSINYAVNGIRYGINFKLISSDYLEFSPLFVEK